MIRGSRKPGMNRVGTTLISIAMKKLFFFFALILYTGTMLFSQCITVNQALADFINQKSQAMNTLKSQIESKVITVAHGVYLNTQGAPSFENWVNFMQVSDDLEELNAQWDEAYGQSMNDILDLAQAFGLCSTLDRDCAEDTIALKWFIFPDEYASVYFETMLGFTSYRRQINDLDSAWLMQADPDIEYCPSLVDTLDEEFWPCMTNSRGVEIRDVNVDMDMLNSYKEEGSWVYGLRNPILPFYTVAYAFPSIKNVMNKHIGLFKTDWVKLLARIKSIGEILTIAVAIVKAVQDMMTDCGESQQYYLPARNRNGFVTIDGQRKIGYTLEQRSVTFDWKASNTKIRGKAKLFKLNSSGKIKGRDRSNKVGIEFCTRQFDVCNKVDYPVDANLIVPAYGFKEKIKKVKLTRQEGIIPFALACTKGIHFLSFSFSYKGNYEKTIPVLAIGVPVSVRCR